MMAPLLWKTFDQLSPIINQLCYSHAIHLAVTDVLYKTRGIIETDVRVTSEKSEDDYSEDFFNSFDLDNDFEFPIFSANYKRSISQIWKIYKLFRKFPIRNTILQNDLKQEKGMRWNSLEVMIERFVTLQKCVVLALNDIGTSYTGKGVNRVWTVYASGF